VSQQGFVQSLAQFALEAVGVGDHNYFAGLAIVSDPGEGVIG
jgi:hypothetical protein